MIISVTLENIFSFKDSERILFTAGKSDKLPTHVSRAKKRDDLSVLKTGLIYGANASGKSNIVRCMKMIRDFALQGWSQMTYEVFKLQEEINNRSSIEVEFKCANNFYAYGVAFTHSGVIEEWLYKIGSRNETLVFERQLVDSQWKTNIAPLQNATDAAFLDFLMKATPAKSTFLYEYLTRNGKGLQCVEETIKWFNNLHIIFPTTKYREMPIRVISDKAFSKEMNVLLNYFGTGISELKRLPIQVTELHIPNEIKQDVLENLSNGSENNKGVMMYSNKRFIYAELDDKQQLQWYELKTIHKMHNGEERIFDIREESDGTIRLFDFIPMLIDMYSNDAVYVIDEIDRSLHPNLTVKLIEFYSDMLIINRDMQLICTTHETHLLEESPIRQDEVWFVEKDKLGASHVVSLCEYKPRANVQKGYLQGRYGAVPLFKNLNNINWDEDETGK